MGRISFTEVASQPDAADQVAFELLFGAIPGIDNSRPLTIACQSVQVVGTSNEAFSVVLHGHNRNFRGRRMNATQMTATFIETSGHEVQERLLRWKEYVAGFESGNSQGYLSEYSVLCQVISYDTTGKVAMRRNVEEVFIQDIPEINHDGSSSAQISINATFKCSRAYTTSIPLL